nr:hypothetical protein [Tanacetum cinerariifolium]
MMGVLTYFFGFQIKQSKRGISINQENYVKDLLKKYDIDVSTVKTPMVPLNKLGPDLNGKAVNETQYRGMIGSLMYLTTSRPNILFSTCLHARHQANPKESHLIAIKRIFRKNTLGACHLLESKLVCWSVKKQNSVAMSSVEAEYAVAAGCCTNILWMKSQLTYYDIIYEKYTAKALKSYRIWVSTPTEEVKEIGYNEEIGVKGTLKKSCLPPRERVIPYLRFISLLIGIHALEYANESLMINPTQVFDVNNWALKPNQPEEPPFTKHMLAVGNTAMPNVPKAPKPSSNAEGVLQGTNPGAKPRHKKHLTFPIQPSLSSSEATKGGSSKRPTSSKTSQLKRKKKSNSTMDSNPSQTLTSTLVVAEMHKEDHQATGDTNSLEVTSKEGAHPQLGSDFTVEADLEISSPNDFVPHRQGPNKGSKNYTPDHTFSEINPSVLVNKTKSARDGSQTAYTHIQEFEIELPEVFKEILLKLETFSSTVSSHTTQVAELKKHMWELSKEFLALPCQISSIQTHIKTPEALPCVTFRIFRFASILNAHNKGVPSAGKSTASPAEGEKNTNPVTEDAELANLIDLMGIDVITNYEVLTKKGPITLKIYREDGSEEVNSNLKVSDLHLAEWREVIQACPDKSEKGWKTIYGLVKTRLDQLTQTEQELMIDLNKHLKEQDPLNELNELATKKKKKVGDFKPRKASAQVLQIVLWPRFDSHNRMLGGVDFQPKHDLDKKIDGGHVTDVDRTTRINIMQELQDLKKLESMDVVQKSRVKWEDIKSAFLDFYKDKFSCHDSSVSFPPMLPAHRLNIVDLDFLESMVSMDELRQRFGIVSFVACFFSTDYRPISLIGIHYKIVAKILANRLFKVIYSIISPEQSTFITGRQIFDGPRILSETIDSYKKCKKKMMLFKISKLILKKPLILGLRPGDPLLPFLFIIVIEGLYMALNDGLAVNMFYGVKVGYPEVGVSSNEVEIVAFYTGCEAGFFPFTYLGLPIGSNMRRIANWQPTIDRFKARLSGWKANVLSIGGILTLVKSVLACIDIRGCHANGVWASMVGSIFHIHSSGIVPLNSIRFKVLCSILFPHMASEIFGFSHGTPQRKRRTELTPYLLLPVGPYGGLDIISLSTLIL